MRVLFAGPSLCGVALPDAAAIDSRGPARQGDLARAVLDGASVIGLVDGRYEDVAATWHKEILFALQSGVTVLGAASMGAMRAAECDAFGMIGIGEVYARYASGDLDDDAAVAQLHGPVELGHVPVTEALVNVEATLDDVGRRGLLDAAVTARLRASARALFFKVRTWPRIAAGAGLAGEEGAAIARLVEANRLDVKRRDALLLIDRLVRLPAERVTPPAGWRMAETQMWRHTFVALGGVPA
jgi:hypothetical protein